MTAIAYGYDGGFYEMSYRLAGGSYAVAGTTANKYQQLYRHRTDARRGRRPAGPHLHASAHNTVPAYHRNAFWSGYAATTAQTPSRLGHARTVLLPLLQVR